MKNIIFIIAIVAIFATIAYRMGWLSSKGENVYDSTRESIVEKSEEIIDKTRDAIR